MNPPLPNLLLITSDQQHWTTLGILNPKIKTPNLDRLAAMGTNFTRAYCPNPTCTPTRSSIITGMYPSAHGAWTLGTKLPEHIPTLGQYLHDAGYSTALVGKAHFQPLKNTPDCESVESYPIMRDLDYWRTFNDEHTPWYGFDRVELARNHGDETHVGQHYAIWMEEHGLKDWREYFQPYNNTGGSKAPTTRNGPGYGWREKMHWQLPEELHYTTWTGQRTIANIERAVQAKQPFFIWSSYHDPHPPYCVPEPWASMYNPDDMDPGELSPGEMERMPLPHRMTLDPDADWKPFDVDGLGNHGYHCHRTGPKYLKQAMAIYYGMISFMDHWIGQTLDALERLGQLDNTLVVFTSDHGHFLGQHGLVAKGPFHYEDVIRVPFLAAWANHIPAGATSGAIQSLVDMAPTFLDAAGVKIPFAMQGLSQLPAWQGGEAVRHHALVENHHNRAAVHLRTMVTDRYKLTVYRGQPEWGELFDLQADPNELHNLFDDPEARGLRASLVEELVQADLAREPAPTPRVWGA